MEDYLFREVRIVSDNFTAIRSRSSDGSCKIKIVMKDDHGVILITNKESDFGTEYEKIARELSIALDKIVQEPCLFYGEAKLDV